jgi:nicotinate-nucleotide adenylyltransferase
LPIACAYNRWFMKVGILGGSFNPVHHGHLLTAVRAAEEAGLDRVLLMPTAVSPLKGRDALAPAKDRLAMVRAAVKGHPLLEASDLEIRRGGVSYSVDTLRELRRRTAARLYWIVGADAFRLVPRWREAPEVGRLASFIVLPRPGEEIRRIPGVRALVLRRAPQVEISSTEIRRRLAAGRPVRYLVPEAVEAYLRRKGLYRA